MKKIIIAGMLVYANSAFCQSDYKHNRITVFKDGTAFIEKSLNAEVKDKIVDLKTTPFVTTATKNDAYKYRNTETDVSKKLIFGSLRFSALNRNRI